MNYEYKLQQFEGPLDLLLHLIDKNKIDIMDIPIAQITDQYMDYLEQIQLTDMDGMSDFLVMAATLLDIKARLLLPPEVDEEGEEIDPRSELVAQLLEYKMYKYMSYELKSAEDEAACTFYHKEDIPAEVKSYRPKVSPEQLLGTVTLPMLQEVFRDVIKRSNDRIDTVRAGFGRIEKEKVNTAVVMRTVRKRIIRNKKCTFRSLLEGGRSRSYIVVTFISILELMRLGVVDAVQDETFGEIYITARDESEWREAEENE